MSEDLGILVGHACFAGRNWEEDALIAEIDEWKSWMHQQHFPED